jgi:hypothetical protein
MNLLVVLIIIEAVGMPAIVVAIMIVHADGPGLAVPS